MFEIVVMVKGKKNNWKRLLNNKVEIRRPNFRRFRKLRKGEFPDRESNPGRGGESAES